MNEAPKLKFKPDTDVAALIQKAQEVHRGVNKTKLINEALREMLRPLAGKRIDVQPSKNFFVRS
jgi:hypothetical protein